MNELFVPVMTKSKADAYVKTIDELLNKLRENNRISKENHKEIQRLRKSNDKAFERAKAAVDRLATY